MIEEQELSIDKRYEQDILYIKTDIISKQPNGNYCKFSKPLKQVTCINMPKDQYLKFWTSKYKNYPEYLEGIKKECENKLNNTYISTEEMIQLIENSKDVKEEKTKAIKYLKSKNSK